MLDLKEKLISKIFYIDSLDFSVETSGSGGTSVSQSAIRTCGNKFMYIGVGDSKKLEIGKWNKIIKNKEHIWFFPVCRNKVLERVPLGFRDLYFAISVYINRKKIFGNNYTTCSIFTGNTFILWIFSFLTGKKRIYYYAPGLRYSDFFTRHRLIGKLIFPFFKKIHAASLNRASIIFAAASKEEINRYSLELEKYGFNKKIRQQPTMINVQIFYPRDKKSMRQKHNLPMDIPIFIYVGRLAKVKGVDFLIDAVSSFKDRYGDCRIIICGDGEQDTHLRTYVDRINMNDIVLFKGNCPSNLVAEYIGASDVCLVGSFYEGFSVAMIEEVVSGRPVVSTNVSGASDLIKDGINGFIVSERNPHIFATKMFQSLKLQESSLKYSNELSEIYDEKKQWDRIMLEIDRYGYE